MAIQTPSVTTTIGEDTYQIQLWGVYDGLGIFHELFRAIGPALQGKILGMVSVASKGGEVPAQDAISFAFEVVQSLPTDLLLKTVRKLAEYTKVEKSGALLDLSKLIDQQFAGRLDLIVAFLAEGLRINYQHFLASQSGA